VTPWESKAGTDGVRVTRPCSARTLRNFISCFRSFRFPANPWTAFRVMPELRRGFTRLGWTPAPLAIINRSNSPRCHPDDEPCIGHPPPRNASRS